MKNNPDDHISVRQKTGMYYTNPKARVIIVGITPGTNQISKSRENLSPREIKRQNAFAGKTMRKNLIDMLDHVGVNNVLGISSCNTLWDDDFDKVEMTSLLKDATSVNDKPITNLAILKRSKKLQEVFQKGFVQDCSKYTHAALFIGLGPGVYSVLKDLASEGVIRGKVIGMSNPSGSNAGRIPCYLHKKEPVDKACQWCWDMATEAQKICKELAYGIKELTIQATKVSEPEVNQGLEEGNKTLVLNSRYERNAQAREICLKANGYKCAVCGFDFAENYGEIGKGFIHVHHTTPIASIGRNYEIDPLKDLVPVCANCHAMLHRKEPPYTIKELKEIIQKKKPTVFGKLKNIFK